MNRRRFITSMIAGGVALMTPRCVNGGLELIAEVAAGEKEESPISKAKFDRLMAYDTVDEVLSEYGIRPVDDESYKRNVYDSDKHVMVLFYNNKSQGSKGLAVLTGLLGEEFGFPFEVFGFKMSEGENTPYNVFARVKKDFGIEDTPFILLYQQNRGIVRKKESVESGIDTHQQLAEGFKLVKNYISNEII